MIVDDIGLVDAPGERQRLEARVRWAAGEHRVGVSAPAGWFVPDDASAFVPLTLLPAMLAGEDLVVDGPVSPLLAHRVQEAAVAYATWNPALRPAEVRAAELAAPASPTAGRHGLYFSLGVDSLYSAALDRGPARGVDLLVFVTDFPPRWGPAVAGARLDQVRHAADDLGLELVVVECNAEDLTLGRGNWGDVHGGALAGLGLALGGALDEVRIATTDSFASLVPYGSHPTLDPLFSTEATVIRHDELTRSRTGKVAMLARDRPDLLAHLHVCFNEERTDNCGVCGKCLLTMVALEAAGVLEHAVLFPDRIDLDALAALRVNPLQSRLHFTDAIRALPRNGRSGAVRAAAMVALRRSARPTPSGRLRLLVDRLRGRRRRAHPSWTEANDSFDGRFHDNALELLVRGEPWPGFDDVARPGVLGGGHLRPR